MKLVPYNRSYILCNHIGEFNNKHCKLYIIVFLNDVARGSQKGPKYIWLELL